MEQRFSRNLKLGYSFSFVMLVAVGLLSYLFIRNLVRSDRAVAHSDLIILKLERTLSLMKDAETGQRGYLLTGREQFLEPYRGAYPQALQLIKQVTSLTSDNAEQQANIAAVREVMVQRMTILQQLVVKRQQGLAINEHDLDAGKAAMDTLRATVDKTEQAEKALLMQRAALVANYAFWTPVIIIAAILIALAIGLFSYIRVARDISEKERLRAELQEKEQETAAFNEELTAANEELTAINEELAEAREELVQANDSLEQKVAERTQELAASEEETQALNEELMSINEELASANEEYIATNEELVQNREELQASEHRARNIVVGAPFPIGVYTGREMRIVMANQAILDVWGKGGDVTGRTYHEVLPELKDSGIYEQLDQVFTTGEPFHARNQRVDIVVDGKLQPFYFNYSFTPLHDANGHIYGVMNTAAEITDLVLAKQQVEQSEDNLNVMIAQAPVAMCILSGSDHVITVANHLMVELWGKPQAEVMNKPVFDALPDARGQGLETIMKNVYETGETFYASELPVSLIRNGKPDIVYQNFVYQAYRGADGHIAGVMAITIDVTEQVLARNELLAIKKHLETELEISKELQQQKDDFIGMASHELKTPITSLSAVIQVAQSKLKNSTDPFLAQAMEKAGVQVKRMIGMINGFLNVSRLESGKIELIKSPFDIGALLAEVIDESKLTAGAHAILLDECSPLGIEADRDKISSVISNLVSNAIKYSPKGKTVAVACTTNGDAITVSVKDEGMGIKPQDIGKIFDRYYRVKTEHTQHIAGFGIGLYLSAEIIRLHEGRIWAESESGKGSTFYFSLPVR
jgi:PAS domain S-box-containing protein